VRFISGLAVQKFGGPTSNGQVADVVEGLVEAANERGVKVLGEWRNVSKFHPIDPARARRAPFGLELALGRTIRRGGVTPP